MEVDTKPDAKVVVVNNLTRNVLESHLLAVFGFYGSVLKIDVPLFGKCLYFSSFFLSTYPLDSWPEQRKGRS